MWVCVMAPRSPTSVICARPKLFLSFCTWSLTVLGRRYYPDKPASPPDTPDHWPAAHRRCWETWSCRRGHARRRARGNGGLCNRNLTGYSTRGRYPAGGARPIAFRWWAGIPATIPGGLPSNVVDGRSQATSVFIPSSYLIPAITSWINSEPLSCRKPR